MRSDWRSKEPLFIVVLNVLNGLYCPLLCWFSSICKTKKIEIYADIRVWFDVCWTKYSNIYLKYCYSYLETIVWIQIYVVSQCGKRWFCPCRKIDHVVWKLVNDATWKTSIQGQRWRAGFYMWQDLYYIVFYKRVLSAFKATTQNLKMKLLPVSV